MQRALDEVSLKRRGIVFVVSAPSGAGKTTLVEQLVGDMSDMVRSCSYTSRKPRPNERQQVDYCFISEEEFKKMAAEGLFLEWAEVFGNFYGTSVAHVETQLTAGVDVVLVIDVQGADQVRESGFEVVTIFVLPPSMAVLRERLSSRADTDGQVTDVSQRLDAAKREVEASGRYDYILVNDEYQSCLERFRSIVIGSRAKAQFMETQRSSIVATFRTQSGLEVDK